MRFDSTAYGATVAEILALDGSGERLMPLAKGSCSSEEARSHLRGVVANQVFAGAHAPDAALAGLWLYFSCLDESHKIAQDVHTPDGSFWHGIMHRQEPDAGNAGYWFRRVGEHPVFPALQDEAKRLGASWARGSGWDPFAFIDFCEEARRKPGSAEEQLAQQVQRAEWQLLFDHCARAAEAGR